MKTIYTWTLTSPYKYLNGKADNLASAVKTVIGMHHPKAKFVCVDLVEQHEASDQFKVYFVDEDEIYEYEIETTTSGVWSLFNQLAELSRCYDRFEITTTTN